MSRVATEGHKTQARDKPIRGMDCPFFFLLYTVIYSARPLNAGALFLPHLGRTLAAPIARPHTSRHEAPIRSDPAQEASLR